MWWLAADLARAYDVVDQPVDRGAFEHLTVKLGGFIQPRFRTIQADADAGTEGEFGFSVQRARLILAGSLAPSPDARYGFGIDQVYSVELMPEPRIQDAYVNARLGTPFQLRLGQFKAPIHRASLASDANSLFPDRNQITTWFSDREIGASVLGWVGKRQVEWQLCAFDGEGTNRLANVNHKLMYAARLVVSPWGSPGADYEILRDWTPTPGKYPPIVSAGGSVFYNVTGPSGQEDAISGYNGELFLHWRFVTAMAEHFHKTEDFEVPSIADFRAFGTYAQVGSFLQGVPWAQDHVAVMGRWEYGDRGDALTKEVPVAGPLDVNQADARYSFGAGLYAGQPLFDQVQDLRLVVSYTLRREREGSPLRDDEFNISTNLTF